MEAGEAKPAGRSPAQHGTGMTGGHFVLLGVACRSMASLLLASSDLHHSAELLRRASSPQIFCAGVALFRLFLPLPCQHNPKQPSPQDRYIRLPRWICQVSAPRRESQDRPAHTSRDPPRPDPIRPQRASLARNRAPGQGRGRAVPRLGSGQATRVLASSPPHSPATSVRILGHGLPRSPMVEERPGCPATDPSWPTCRSGSAAAQSPLVKWLSQPAFLHVGTGARPTSGIFSSSSPFRLGIARTSRAESAKQTTPKPQEHQERKAAAAATRFP